MRLDLYLTTNFNIQSRNKACELIKSNKVKIDGAIISKPSFNVEDNHIIEILEEDFIRNSHNFLSICLGCVLRVLFVSCMLYFVGDLFRMKAV